MATILVCDDAPLAREAVRRAVGGVPGVERVTAAGSGEEVLARYPLERPDLVLMDVRMPGIGGVEASRRLVAAHPQAAVVMLTMGEDPKGWLAPSGRAPAGTSRRTRRARRSPRRCRSPCPRPGTRPARRHLRSHPVGAPPSLTEREQQVLEGMSRGKSNAEIGAELFLSEDTVKTHARRLFRKVGAADRAQAVALGFRWGFLR